MNDLLDAARAVAALAHEPIATPEDLPPAQEAFTRDTRLGQLAGLSRKADAAQLDQALDIVAPALVGGDPYQVGRIALLCGGMVENGGDASRLAPRLVDVLPQHLALANTAVQQAGRSDSLAEGFARQPDAIKAMAGLDFLLYAAMTALCRHLPSRVRARANDAIVDALPPLADHSPPADFLTQLLGYTDDKTLLVLHPGERKGWRVRLTAVNTNFHLFTLLQARLVGPDSDGKLPGEPTAPDVAAIARGQIMPTTLVYDNARFHFHTAAALRTDGTLSADIGGWVWGEGTPKNIPVAGGEPVVVLGPMLLASRGWDGNFFANIHDALRSDAEIVETLTSAQAAQAIHKLASGN